MEHTLYAFPSFLPVPSQHHSGVYADVYGWKTVTCVEGPLASSSLLGKTEKADPLQSSEVFGFVPWTQLGNMLIAMGSGWKLVGLSFRAQLELYVVGSYPVWVLGTKHSTTELAL